MNSAHSIEKSRSRADDRADVTSEISKVGVYTIAIAAGVIGCWATLCIIAGTISSGGPVELISGFFKALAG